MEMDLSGAVVSVGGRGVDLPRLNINPPGRLIQSITEGIRS
jgi:hypothetical protein